MYYFGEWPEKSVDKGRYLFNRSGYKIQYQYTPWGNQIKRIPPQDTKIDGKAKVHQKDKWTALAFWDGNSPVVFFAQGKKSFDEMCSFAEKNFSDVWSRYQFEIKEWKD